jgi:hypothetical protein
VTSVLVEVQPDPPVQLDWDVLKQRSYWVLGFRLLAETETDVPSGPALGVIARFVEATANVAEVRTAVEDTTCTK